MRWVRGCRLRRWLSLVGLVTVVLAPEAQAGSTFVLVNVDGPGEGLNDPTPISAKGGNSATSLGEARLQAVELAVALWANLLTSEVPIRVEVQFDPMGGTESSAVLGLGGASAVFRDFLGAPRPATWYPSALADRLAGMDLDPIGSDLSVIFNSDVDGDQVLGPSRFYYGFDAAPPEGDVDFVTIALHEFAHGLGFQTYVDLDTGAKLFGHDDAYLVHVEHHGAVPADLPSMTDAERLAAITAGPALHWTGPGTLAAASGLTAGVGAGGHLEMYAPDPAEPRRSLEHFNTAVSPDDLLAPFYLSPKTRLLLTRSVLEDIGWGGAGQCVDPGQ